MLNQKAIQLSNKKILYKLISENPGISRAKLAAKTKLSKTTVSALVEQLIQNEFVVDTGANRKGVLGRSPNNLVVDSAKNCVIVCNLRKRVMQIACVSAGYDVEHIHEIELGDSALEPGKILDPIKAYLNAASESRYVIGVCVIIPGIIDLKRKEIVSVVLSLRDSRKLINELRKGFGNRYPVALLNDSACFAYAENAFGDIESDNYIYININEGVGASFINDGKLLGGANGMGTQFGHFSIQKDGVDCVCGNKGCLENYIGESVLSARAKALGIADEFAHPDRIRFKDVGRQAESGSAGAIRLINLLAEEFSYGLGNLITLFRYETVVIGGMGRNLGEIFLDEVQTRVRRFGFRPFTGNVTVAFTNLEDEAIFKGAAKYFIDLHYDFDRNMSGKLVI